jgi:acyl-CoA thioester hydrolase
VPGRFSYECPLRWSDLDVYGHVNNSRFLTLYEEARVALMFIAAAQAGLTSFEQGIVISRHEIDYLRPVDFRTGPGGVSRPPRVRIDLWIDQIRAASFTVGYELFDGDAVASRARSVCVPYDLTGQRLRRLSPAERAFLEDWRV